MKTWQVAFRAWTYVTVEAESVMKAGELASAKVEQEKANWILDDEDGSGPIDITGMSEDEVLAETIGVPLDKLKWALEEMEKERRLKTQTKGYIP